MIAAFSLAQQPGAPDVRKTVLARLAEIQSAGGSCETRDRLARSETVTGSRDRFKQVDPG